MSGSGTPSSAASNAARAIEPEPTAPTLTSSNIAAHSAPTGDNVDIGWTYGFWPNLNVKNKVQCKLCKEHQWRYLQTKATYCSH